MIIVNAYESTWYREDTDDEHIKDEYYGGEFWDACDYLTIPSEEESFGFRLDTANDEVVVDEHYNYEYDELLIRFASEGYGKYFTELSTGNDFKVEDDPKYDPSKPYIKYRGGKGYYYYHHQYNYDI